MERRGAGRQQAGSNLAGLRDHNTGLVVNLLRAAEHGSSRVELAAETGLTPQAISKITARLLAEGLVVAAGQSASTGGKPRTLLALRADAACAVGIGLDRSQTTVLLMDLAGRTRQRWSVDIGLATADDPSQTIDALAEHVRVAVDAAPAGAKLLGVGVGCRGPLDYGTGVLHRPAGLAQWDGFPLREALAARLDGPSVLLDKDTNTAVLATPAPAPGSTAYLHLADGLGAGMLLDGAVYRGVRTNAGEFGHQVLQPDGPRCSCGARGCLEALCLEALARGEVQTAAEWLGIGAANLVRLLDIDRILLGGYRIFESPDVYVRAVADQIAGHLPDPAWQDVEVSLTLAGTEAVAVGAARLVVDAQASLP